MSFIDFFRTKKETVSKETEQPMQIEVSLSDRLDDLYADVYIHLLAFYSNVNRIANAFCKCSFETYIDNKQTKGREWYTWNVQPNKNQNASVFKNQLITTLYEKNEVLIIEMPDGDLYVADSYTHDEYAIYEDVFRNVQVRNLSLSSTFYQSDVLFIKLNDVNIKKLVNGLSNMMQRLMTLAMKSYAKSKGEKIVLDINEIAKGSSKFTKDYQKLMEEDFKQYFESENSVLPLFEGYSINQNSKKPDGTSSPKDVIDLMNNAIEVNAIALNVPIPLAKGNVQDTTKVINEFLTFCIDPLVGVIEEEIIRKRYGLNEVSKGNYLKVNSKTIQHIDIFDVSAAIEKLVSSACFTVNDIRREMGLPIINEDWANQFFMTKNFSTIEELMKLVKGGEDSDV